ncbi:hypothetical protein V6251_14350 [Olleya sp. Ti.3.14]|uniref:hypothetical protein n=1 Tax=Olleya sp. Ti.3.14 TaxID=3121297 RepID=UPI00311FF00D
MKLINYLTNKAQVFTVLFTALALSSCGSYQYVGQTTDGIYDTGTENRQYESEAIPAENNNDYYSNYFKEKADEAEIYSQTEEIFTDVDTYQGDYDDSIEVAEQNAGWGATNSNVIINIHDTGFYNDYGWGWNRPWGWNGWYNWGWNSPYSWRYGWGWNNSFYNSYWRSPYYGFNNFGYGYGYGYSYTNGYHRRGISYNSGRRGSLVNRNSVLSSRYSRNSTVRPRTNTTTRPRTSTTRPRTNSTSKPRLNTTRPRTNTSTPRPRTNTSTPRPRTNTSTPRSNNSTPRSISTPRSSTPSRSRSTSGGSSRRGRG